MADYVVEEYETIDEATARLAALDNSLEVNIITIPYWRRESPRSLDHKYVLKIGRDTTGQDVNTTTPELKVYGKSYPTKVGGGEIPGSARWIKSGYCGIGAATGDLWAKATTYVFPAAATRMEVVSSAVADTLAFVSMRGYLEGIIDGRDYE